MNSVRAGLAGFVVAVSIPALALAQAVIIPAPGQAPTHPPATKLAPKPVTTVPSTAPAAPAPATTTPSTSAAAASPEVASVPETPWQVQHQKYGSIDPTKMTCADFAKANPNDRHDAAAMLTDRAHGAGTGSGGVVRHYVPVPVSTIDAACQGKPGQKVAEIVSSKVGANK